MGAGVTVTMTVAAATGTAAGMTRVLARRDGRALLNLWPCAVDAGYLHLVDLGIFCEDFCPLFAFF